MRYKFHIEYDGTNYVGWQKQKDAKNRSIEEILENAIISVVNEKIKLNCAGRTDAGVHALNQIADFAIDKEFEPFRIMMGVNNNLQDSAISVINCEIVKDDFNSRFNAKSRSYLYRIINRKSRLALEKNRAWHVPINLEIEKMQEGANHLIGTFDFTSFRDAKCEAKSAIKTINYIKINKYNEEITIEINADAFLHHMVRNIVGTLVMVGLKKISPALVKEILLMKNRTTSGQNAPACGLYFLGANY